MLLSVGGCTRACSHQVENCFLLLFAASAQGIGDPIEFSGIGSTAVNLPHSPSGVEGCQGSGELPVVEVGSFTFAYSVSVSSGCVCCHLFFESVSFLLSDDVAHRRRDNWYLHLGFPGDGCESLFGQFICLFIVGQSTVTGDPLQKHAGLGQTHAHCFHSKWSWCIL